VDLARPDEVSGPAAHALSLRYRSGTPGDAEEVATLLEVENGRRADLDELRGLLGAWPSVLAHDGDRLVGAFYSRGFSPDMIELRNTIVAAEHRRAGVGAEMARRFEAEARSRGYRAMIGVNCWLHRGATREGASAARGFWVRMGWSIVFATDGSAVVAKHL
jgi:GNAT superfamily N-acetyltransferase